LERTKNKTLITSNVISPIPFTITNFGLKKEAISPREKLKHKLDSKDLWISLGDFKASISSTIKAKCLHYAKLTIKTSISKKIRS